MKKKINRTGALRNLPLHIILYAIALLAAAACSRSLTDIGYGGTPTDTYNLASYNYKEAVPTLGKETDYITPTLAGVPERWRAIGDGLSHRAAILMSSRVRVDSLTKGERNCLFFLQSFYADLCNNFKPKRFSGKYLPHCTDSVRGEIAAYDTITHKEQNLHGWEIFTYSARMFSLNHEVNYLGRNWYRFIAYGDRAWAVDVRATKERRRGIVISGVRNKLLGVYCGKEE